MQTMTLDEMALTLGDCEPIVSPEALVAAYFTPIDPCSRNGYAIVMNCSHIPRGTILKIGRDKYTPPAYLMLSLFDKCPSMIAVAQSACLVDDTIVVPEDDSVKDFMLAIIMLASSRTFHTTGNCPLTTTACFLISKMFLTPAKYLHFSPKRFAEKEESVGRIKQEVYDLRNRPYYPVVFRPAYVHYYWDVFHVYSVVRSYQEYYVAEPYLDPILEAMPHVFTFMVDQTILKNAPTDLAQVELWLEGWVW
jgi:hypothetical protein